MLEHREVLDRSFESQDLTKADFLGSEFTRCNFDSSVLARAYITGARFNQCTFRFADFSGAYIFCSQFKDCDLTGATLDQTLLSTVDFTGTRFDGVEFNGTRINSAPLLVEGIEYPITALDNGYMQVGCEFNTMEWFWRTDEKHSAVMEGLRARRFWKRNKAWIFDMLVARRLFEKSS